MRRPRSGWPRSWSGGSPDRRASAGEGGAPLRGGGPQVARGQGLPGCDGRGPLPVPRPPVGVATGATDEKIADWIRRHADELLTRALPAWTPLRHEAYIGVLVDDLITRGTAEPYRMFTSRAEYRLLLREDNADLRLTPVGRDMSLVDDARWIRFCAKREAIERGRGELDALWLKPGQLRQPDIVETFGEAPSDGGLSGLDLLRRPQGSYAVLQRLGLAPTDIDSLAAEQIEIEAKYAGYIERQQIEIERNRRYEEAGLPADFDYAAVVGLSNEVRTKLLAHRPQTVGQAARISGVTPAAVSLLLIHLRRSGILRRAG